MTKINLSKKQIRKILSDVSEQLPLPPTAVRGLYSLPSGIQLKYANSDDRRPIIQDLCDHIGFYLGILSRIDIQLVDDIEGSFDFVVDNRGTAIGKHRYPFAGMYTTNFAGRRKIYIANEQQYRFDNLAAIMAHECTHNYVHIHKIDCNEVDGEILTDTLAAYLGLGFLLLKGYENFGLSIGYITDKSIKNTILCAMQTRKWRPKEIAARFESVWDKFYTHIHSFFS